MNSEYEAFAYEAAMEEETFHCEQCGSEIDQVTYVNNDLCHECEQGQDNE